MPPRGRRGGGAYSRSGLYTIQGSRRFLKSVVLQPHYNTGSVRSVYTIIDMLKFFYDKMPGKLSSSKALRNVKRQEAVLCVQEGESKI